jgi:hypothetical protein
MAPATDDRQIVGYSPTTGEPIYRTLLDLTGRYEYFVENFGTVYADSPEDVMAKVLKGTGENVPNSRITLLGVSTVGGK